MSLANDIKDRRKKSKLTQSELSQKTGISQGALSRFESGEITFSPPSLERVMVALGVGERTRQRWILDWFQEQIQD